MSFAGRHHAEFSKKKISKAMRGNKYGIGNKSWKGRHLAIRHRSKISAGLLNSWKGPRRAKGPVKPCDICSGRQQGRGRALARDHNHKTGELRGKLCDMCNRALGLFKVDVFGVKLLKNAIAYMKMHGEEV